VNTIAIPCSSAAAITSASRTDPPGWMAAVAPAAAAASRPSRKGKNASDATTVPFVGRWAFITAILAESTRLICPAPTPTVRSLRTYTMALDLTCLQTFQPNSRASISSEVGGRFVTTLRSAACSTCRSRLCRSRPPLTFFISWPVCALQRNSPPVSSTRRFALAERIFRASLSTPGAMTASKKLAATSRAVSAPTGRLNPITPP
jgi:hypothetical protein